MSNILTPSIGQIVPIIEQEMKNVESETRDEKTSEIWYTKMVKKFTIAPIKKIVTTIPVIDARIKKLGSDGNQFKPDEISLTVSEETFEFAGSSLILKENDVRAFETSGALVGATQWTTDITGEGILYPQQLLADGLVNNTLESVDGAAFFGVHQNNLLDASRGTYNNLLTGSASGEYPGACPVFAPGVSTDTAVENLAKVRAYVQTRRTANGISMTNVKIDKVFCAPSAAARFSQVMGAKTIAQDSAGAGGSANVEAVISYIGVGELVICPELEVDPTTYYVSTKAAQSGPIGAIRYSVIDEFQINYLNGRQDFEMLKNGCVVWDTKSWFGLRGGTARDLFKVRAS